MLVLPHEGGITMSLSTSKLTKKYQATIPEPIRKQLQLSAGDSVVFDLRGEQVQLRKARPVDLAFLQSLEGTLTEWSSDADEEAYSEL